MGYGICSNTASFDDVTSCLSPTYWKLIALGRIWCSINKELQQMDKDFYVISCPHSGIECLVAQLEKLLTHYGCRSAIGLQLQSLIELLILELGLTSQPFGEDFSQ